MVSQVECPEGFLVEWEECRVFQEECLEECPAVWEAHQAVWVVLGCQILVNYYLILSCCRPSRYFCLNWIYVVVLPGGILGCEWCNLIISPKFRKWVKLTVFLSLRRIQKWPRHSRKLVRTPRILQSTKTTLKCRKLSGSYLKSLVALLQVIVQIKFGVKWEENIRTTGNLLTWN